jgi:hypothetical protein
MKKLTLIIIMAMVLPIASWMLDPTQSAAKKLGSSAGISYSAHVSGVVIGKPVRSERGVVLGTVQNIVLTDNGCAKYVILSGQFSGARSRLFPIPWTVIARTGPDAIFVDLDSAVLADAPSFEVNSWPDFAQWDTRIHSFYQKKAEVTVPGTTRTPGALRSEEKARSEKDLRAKQKDWGKQAAEGARSTEKKATEKSLQEKERKHIPSEMGTQGAVESPKHREMDIKTKQHTEPKAGGTAGTMERGQTQMKERGQTQMMERGKLQEEKSMQKAAPGHVGVPVVPGQAGENIK